MSEELMNLIAWLKEQADDPKGMATADRTRLTEAATTLESMKIAMHAVDGYCNQVRGNYRSGSQEEIIASTVKTKIREFLRG